MLRTGICKKIIDILSNNFVSDLQDLYLRLLMIAIMNCNPVHVFRLYHSHTKSGGLYEPTLDAHRGVALFLYKASTVNLFWIGKAAKVVLHATKCELYPEQPAHQDGRGITIRITTNMDRWEIHLMIVACLNNMHRKFSQMLKEGNIPSNTDFNVEILIEDVRMEGCSADIDKIHLQMYNMVLTVLHQDLRPPIQTLKQLSSTGRIHLFILDVRQYLLSKNHVWR